MCQSTGETGINRDGGQRKTWGGMRYCCDFEGEHGKQ